MYARVSSVYVEDTRVLQCPIVSLFGYRVTETVTAEGSTSDCVTGVRIARTVHAQVG